MTTPEFEAFWSPRLAKAGVVPPTPDENATRRRAPVLKFLRPCDLLGSEPEPIKWLVPRVLASGAITELSGAPKLSGKSTFAFALTRSVVRGENFLGKPTSQAPVVMLTEQSKATLNQPLTKFDLLEEHKLFLLTYSSIGLTEWERLIDDAVNHCRNVGAQLLIVDTLPQFARLRGDEENTSGKALEVMSPLQIAAAECDLSILVTRHDTKSEGSRAKRGRGSTAWSGAVDIVLSLQYCSNARPTARRLEGNGRFDESNLNLVIELDGSTYRVASETGSLSNSWDLEQSILEVHESASGPLLPEEVQRLIPAATHATVKTFAAVMTGMWKKGQLERVGAGKRGSPYRYAVAMAPS